MVVIKFVYEEKRSAPSPSFSRASFIFSPTSTRSFADIEVDEEDQDLIPPANGPPANGPAMTPIIPETTQATTTSTFAPWRTSRRTTGKYLLSFLGNII